MLRIDHKTILPVMFAPVQPVQAMMRAAFGRLVAMKGPVVTLVLSEQYAAMI